jgi:hypothetical protein
VRSLFGAAFLPALTSALVVVVPVPAHAADPGVLVCDNAERLAGQLEACDYFDPANQLVVYEYCFSQAAPSPDKPTTYNLYTFTGALAGGRYVASISTSCWIGTARATQPGRGQWGYMAAGQASGPKTEASLQLCTQWSVYFVSGNPYGYDPAKAVPTTEKCFD